jgi:hypothetical protein
MRRGADRNLFSHKDHEATKGTAERGRRGFFDPALRSRVARTLRAFVIFV